MKLTCKSSILKESIAIVERAISNRSTLPTLENIFFDLTETELTLRGNDLEIGIEHRVPITDVQETGQVLIKANTISHIMSKLGNETVSIAVDEHSKATIQSGQVDFELLGAQTSDYPAFPSIESGIRLSTTVEQLSGLIKDTLFAVSTDETKQFLNGILVKNEGDSIVFVSTDGYRLAIRKEGFGTESGDFSVIIPNKAMSELNKIIQGKQSTDHITINISQTQVAFQMDRFLLIARVIQGQFPDYTKVLPQTTENDYQLSRRQLLSACERASIIASAANNVIRFIFSDNQLTIKAQAPGTGEFKESLTVSRSVGTNDQTKIAFNVKLIVDALRHMDSDDVMVAFNSELSPCVIRPITDDLFTYIVMPIRMSDYEKAAEPETSAAVSA